MNATRTSDSELWLHALAIGKIVSSKTPRSQRVSLQCSARNGTSHSRWRGMTAVFVCAAAAKRAAALSSSAPSAPAPGARASFGDLR